MKTLLEKFRDTTARKPSGWLGKKMYENPKGHQKSFEIIIEKLGLKENDSYLEVACGGGVLLDMALQKVQRAAAIDHSDDMVALAKKRNQAAVNRGTVEIIKGNAEKMVWPDGSFSCSGCANAFFFFNNPELVLKEISRVLGPQGRLVMTSVTHKKSIANFVFKRPYNLNLYSDEQMEQMLAGAGFSESKVETISGMQVSVARK